MVPRTIASLYRVLWPEAGSGLKRTWAVLDGARHPAIGELVRSSYRECYPLFGTGLDTALARNSPMLLLIQSNDLATRGLLQSGWGCSWGIFLRSRLSGPALCRQLSRLIRVRDEFGRRLVLRFYDPRAFRAFLPTCDEDQLAEIFSGVEDFVIEAEDSAACLRFWWEPEGAGRHSGLRREELRLDLDRIASLA